MRHLGKLVGLAVIALAFAGSPAAQADPGTNANLVDGTITLSDISCTWQNATTIGNPPDDVTIPAANVNPLLSCTGASNVTVNNDTVVTFDDLAGTAIADKVNVTGIELGVSCTYQATNITLTRDGTTRHYTGTYTGYKQPGSHWICPSTRPGTADVTFH